MTLAIPSAEERIDVLGVSLLLLLPVAGIFLILLPIRILFFKFIGKFPKVAE